ncbi:MAG: OmpA family protein [Phycisphaeraceae bacterium]|nr:OmpA family protein [Phycisphaeraceae bacterium]
MTRQGWIRTCRLAFGGLLLAAGLNLGGCNTNNANLVEMNRALQDRNQSLTAQNESLNNLNQQLQDALNARDRALEEQTRLLADLRAGKAGAEQALLDFERRFGALNFGSLDPQTDNALRQLAAAHSDLLEYIPERGLLRFKSDFTFASGSDVVNDNARNTLRQLAAILNGAAANYDIRVIGHTDSQQISAATARRHPTNVHLSAHRAISVRDVLVQSAVRPDRVEVAGRGEFDPVVPNNPGGNTPQNRRVEIFLDRPRARVGAPAPAPAPARAPAPAPVEVMK